MRDTFHDDLIAILPKLRVQALALTRNRAAAEDLVQDTVVNALSARAQFQPGTNFAAWVHRILRNRFISDVRKRRPSVTIEDAPLDTFAINADPADRLITKELAHALDLLPAEQREALLLMSLQGMCCEDIAEVTGCAVGTVKSRVFRARATLQRSLMGETAEEVAGQVTRRGARRDAGTTRNHTVSSLRDGSGMGTRQDARIA